jgi:hypothetical protein
MRFLVSLRRGWHLLSYGGEGRGGEGRGKKEDSR